MNSEQQARFWSKVEVRGSDECWPWIGAIHSNGYGSFWAGGSGQQAHRVSLAMVEPPVGIQLALHTCDNRACVNPKHLYWGDHIQNMDDMWSRGRQGGASAQNVAKTHCPKGHEYSGDNVRTSPEGRRNCRACHRDRTREYKRKKRAAVRAHLTQEQPR